jgi:hypothetical protein
LGQLGLYAIAERLGRPRSLIQRWFDLFRQGGLERLLHQGRGKGIPSRLTAEAAAALRQKLEAGGWRRAVVDVHPRYPWGYLFGALQVGGGGTHFCYCPAARLEMCQAFLQQLAAREPEAIHVVLWDGAGFHPGDGAPDLPANGRVIAFPPYSPELNPVEKLWDQVKDRICNQPFGSLRALEPVMTDFLWAFWEDARRVASLVGQGWLPTQADRFFRQHSSAMNG